MIPESVAASARRLPLPADCGVFKPLAWVCGVLLALGAVAPIPMRARAAESLLVGHKPANDLFREVGAIAAEESRPIDDLRASKAYRRHLVDVLTQCALRKAIEQAQISVGVV